LQLTGGELALGDLVRDHDGQDQQALQDDDELARRAGTCSVTRAP
jgi:hypothetical protein